MQLDKPEAEFLKVFAARSAKKKVFKLKAWEGARGALLFGWLTRFGRSPRKNLIIGKWNMIFHLTPPSTKRGL